ncbi:DinB family protein [Jiulongibacter sediminis]|jgi:hypothetical protein|uniref:DinB family protein n=1 Tax=Jiulongibacter sediminis TaxID=1605367 RepID=UPI0026EE5295|nr:DinB family protein [Jiulongibacter sediminis]
MTSDKLPEVWLRGPLPEVPALLQPAAHSLLQTVEELKETLADFPDDLMIREVAGRATVAFHARHMTGVLDRMMTYSKGLPLSEMQFDFLKGEKKASPLPNTRALITQFEDKVKEAFLYFKSLEGSDLTEQRIVGRKHLPSTVIGLLYHAAEHAQRHLGQLIVTVSVLRAQ